MGNKGSHDSSLRISSQRFEDLQKETGSQEEERALEASRRLVLLRKYEYYAGIEFSDFDDDRSATAKELSLKSSDEIERKKHRERKSLSFAAGSTSPRSFSSPLQLQREQEEQQREEEEKRLQQQQQQQQQEQEEKQKIDQEEQGEGQREDQQQEQEEQEQEDQEREHQDQEQGQRQEQKDQEQQQKEGEGQQRQPSPPPQQFQFPRHQQPRSIENNSVVRYEELLKNKKITPKAAKSLEAFTEDVMRWILDEAEKNALEIEREKEREKEREREMQRERERGDGVPQVPVFSQIESDDERESFEKGQKWEAEENDQGKEGKKKAVATITSQHIQSAIQSLLSVTEEKGKQDFENKIGESIRTFFDLLHFGDWTFVVRKHDVHVMRVCDPDFLCIRATTTMKGSPAEILECILDFESAPSWDLLLQSSEALEYLDSQTAVLQTKYVAEYCLLKEARDFVILCRWFWRAEDSSLCFVARSVDHPLGVLPPGYVRGNMLTGGYLISPLKGDPNVSRVTRLLALDVVKAPEFILDTVARLQPSVLNRFKKFAEKKIQGMKVARRPLRNSSWKA